MTKLQEKLYLTTIGYGFAGANFLLIDTRFWMVGVGFGVLGLVFFIKALRIKQ